MKSARAREMLVIVFSVLLSLAVHGHYVVPGLGEADAARFARIAFAWHLRGKISYDEVGYQVRTSALYLDLERLALDHGLRLAALPGVVNWTSVFFGTACSVALYFLFRRLTKKPIAAAATLAYSLTPGFWLGNIYGMPTVPALFFFVVALILFLDATRFPGRSPSFICRIVGAFIFMWLAMTFKSDLALSGGAFLAAALLRPDRRFRLCCYAATIVVGATIGSILFSRLVVAPSTNVGAAGEGLLEFLKHWNQSFAITPDALLNDSNSSAIVRCAGGLLFCVIVLSLCRGLVVGGVPRKQALLALLWGLPPILAWGIRFGNSARHSVPAFPPLVLVATLFLFEIAGGNQRRGSLLLALTMLLSYCSNLSGENSLRPRSNLIALSEEMEKYAVHMHDHARKVISTPELRRVLIGGYVDPYCEFELFAAAKNPEIEIDDHWTLIDGDRKTIIDYGAYLEGKSPRQLVREYRKRGFEPISLSYRL